MAQAKKQESIDIQIANRAIKALTPYLIREGTITPFTKKRIFLQLSEIQNEHLKSGVYSYYYFCLGDPKKGIEYAEHALTGMPTNEVAWKNYALGALWCCGAVEALPILKRALAATNSPHIASVACAYASAAADYSYFLEAYSFIIRTETYDEVVSDKEKPGMERSYELAGLAEKHNKCDTIKSLSALMYQALSLNQKLNAGNSLFLVSESDDTPEFIYEISIEDVGPDICAKMNIDLISARVNAGLMDWSVGGVFVNELTEIRHNAC